MINILLVDDQILFTWAMKSMLSEFKDFKVEGVNSGTDAIKFIKKNKIDVVLLDIDMPGMDGFETANWINQRYDDVRVIMLTMHTIPGIITASFENGARGFLSKNSTPPEIYEAIHTVMKTGYYINEESGRALAQKIRPSTKESRHRFGIGESVLTDREKEILTMIANEMTGEEIAKILGLTARTVNGYRHKMLEKTGSKNTAGLVMYGVKNDIIDLN